MVPMMSVTLSSRCATSKHSTHLALCLAVVFVDGYRLVLFQPLVLSCCCLSFFSVFVWWCFLGLGQLLVYLCQLWLLVSLFWFGFVVSLCSLCAVGVMVTLVVLAVSWWLSSYWLPCVCFGMWFTSSCQPSGCRPCLFLGLVEVTGTPPGFLPGFGIVSFVLATPVGFQVFDIVSQWWWLFSAPCFRFV